MAFDIRVQNVLEKKPGWKIVVWPLGLKKASVTDRGGATGVTEFRMASGGLRDSQAVVSHNLRVLWSATT